MSYKEAAKVLRGLKSHGGGGCEDLKLKCTDSFSAHPNKKNYLSSFGYETHEQT